jgi:hypothetical protein
MEEHGVVEEGALAFADAVELAGEVGDLLPRHRRLRQQGSGIEDAIKDARAQKCGGVIRTLRGR